MNHYEERKERRIDRAENRADKNRKIASNNSMSKVCGEENTGIPMGQPILVGHHSESRHRNHLKRIDNKLKKGFDASSKADYYDNKADAIASRTAIDSDDPEAVTKLKAKIESLERLRTTYKAQNKAVRGTIPSYEMTSISTKIRRYKGRLEAEQAKSEMVEIDWCLDNGIEVKESEGRIQVFFTEKPSEEIRKIIKSWPHSLKWSRYSEAWVRKLTTTTGEYWRSELKTYLGGLPC